MKPSRIYLLASITALVAWGGYRIYRAHANLVTLNVRNMDVRRVVSKIEWQTWEHIVVSKNVGGNVTLNVHSVPLDEVLNIVALQTDSRWTRLYPIYSTKKSLGAFNQVLQGTLAPDANGWVALQQLAMWQQAGLSGFANTLRAENKLVSAQLTDKDAAYTALALSRFSKAQVVPEDGTKGAVNLTLQQVPFDKAVGKVAKQLHHKWARVYTLQPLNGATLARRAAAATVAPNAGADPDTNQVVVTQNQVPLPPDRALEAIVSTMTPEERQQTLDQIANAGAGGGFSPGGGQPSGPAGASSVGSGATGTGPGGQSAQPPQEDMETRIENRLKNGTIDQRLAHDRSVLNGKKSGK